MAAPVKIANAAVQSKKSRIKNKIKHRLLKQIALESVFLRFKKKFNIIVDNSSAPNYNSKRNEVRYRTLNGKDEGVLDNE